MNNNNIDDIYKALGVNRDEYLSDRMTLVKDLKNTQLEAVRDKKKEEIIHKLQDANVALSAVSYKYSKGELKHEYRKVYKICKSRLNRLKSMDNIESINNMNISH